MARGAFALVWKRADVRPLVDADHALELSGNEQLRQASVERQEKHRRETAWNVDERLRLLRGNLVRSFVLMVSAVVVAVALARVIVAIGPAARAWLGGGSVFCFAWATLARIGWAGQSHRGDTVVERLDERIFKLLYWVATLLGTLALV
jgi:hypothetical protein